MDGNEVTPQSPVLINFPGKGLVISHSIGGLAKDIAASMTRDELEMFIRCLVEQYNGDSKPDDSEPDSEPESQDNGDQDQDDGNGDGGIGEDEAPNWEDGDYDHGLGADGGADEDTDWDAAADADAQAADADDGTDAAEVVKQIVGKPEAKQYSDDEIMKALSVLGIQVS